ncbi:hypothetical protein [Chromobacterium aquaticum]|uniref:Tail fiber protein n=1 Tax=Chromobacterium aquaticum TaxID=467180 RepID=A0ABV8ZRW4_9NEIS|nr:hypothetical protein [Chromobacterium aquaticum]MCD5360701.1 hypothetical protein [Chromobacterium aquaticum]
MQNTLKPINSPDGLFHDGNPTTGELGTIVSADWLNSLQQATATTQDELITLIKDSGQALDANRKDQLLQAVKQIAWGGYAKPDTLAGYGIIDAATKVELKTAIDRVVNGAPGALDTLQELAAALGNDQNFAATVTNKLATKADKSNSLAGYGIADAYTKAEVMEQSLIRSFFMPEIQGALGNKLSISTSLGQIVINGGSSIVWRGTRVYDVAAYPVERRSFLTEANKVYHLRWRPLQGFVMFDLANDKYNPQKVPDTHLQFDSQPDDALIALIEVNAENNPVVNAYENIAIYAPKILLDVFSTTRIVTNGLTTLFANTFKNNYARSYRGRIDWDLSFGATTGELCFGQPSIELDGVKIGHGTRWHLGIKPGCAYTSNYSGHRIQVLNRGSHVIKALFRNETAAAVVFNPGNMDASTWDNSGSSLSVTALEVI